MLKRSVNLLTHVTETLNQTINGVMKDCINIGCGLDIKPFWINCDIHPASKLIKRFDISNSADLNWLKTKRADLITCDHVIGYLTVAQADNFFNACYNCLREGGVFILEFPDLKKILDQLLKLDYMSITIDHDYIEIIRAIYAYDQKDAMSTDFNMKTYITGWTSDFLIHRLKLAGFTQFSIENPKTHEQRTYRDTRIEVFK